MGEPPDRVDAAVADLFGSFSDDAEPTPVTHRPRRRLVLVDPELQEPSVTHSDEPCQHDDCGRSLTSPCADAVPCACHVSFAELQNSAGQAAVAESRANLPPRTWRQLERVDLAEEFRKPVRTVREPPRWFRGQLRRAFAVALQQWQRDKSTSSWKLVLLIPRLLLQPTAEKGGAGKKVFEERMQRFLRGEWLELLAQTPAAEQRGSR